VAEDIFVKVGNFHFPTDFVVVDFEADLWVPLILGRSFLRTGRALIDVYGEEITLRVNVEAITFNLNQTTRYSSTYDDISVNRIDVINIAREEYAQEMLGFSKNSSGSNPTPTSKPIIFDSSPSLTLFEGNDFILEKIEAYLKDESISPEIDHADCDPEGDICLVEKLLNDDPFQLPPMDLKYDSQFGYDCQPQFPLNYKSEQGYNDNYTSYPYDSSSLPQQYPYELKRLSNLEYRDEIKITELKENFNGMSIEISKKEKLLQQEQWSYLSTHPSKRLHYFCYDDDDDDEDYTSAITPDESILSTKEPDNSLSMRDEYLDTIPA
nr:reverse transcriptase domain-containing protein [Tanacetum cinerariifolium]